MRLEAGRKCPASYFEMNKITFIFVVSLYLLFGILSIIGDVDTVHQLFISLAAIIAIGIPHGALDNRIFLQSQNISSSLFYLIYVGAMAINGLLWFIVPQLSLAFFLLLSSYHFGQSQFASYSIHSTMKRVLYTFWGISIISALIYYRREEILGWINQDSSLAGMQVVLSQEWVRLLVILSSAFAIFILLAQCFLRKINVENLVMELIILGLLHLSFFTLPAILSFTIYFVVLHSAKVLIDEYQHFIKLLKGFTFWKFLKMLLPLTIISIVMLLFAGLVVYQDWIEISPVLLSLILISVFTLPHSVVMEIFYERLQSSKS